MRFVTFRLIVLSVFVCVLTHICFVLGHYSWTLFIGAQRVECAMLIVWEPSLVHYFVACIGVYACVLVCVKHKEFG